jgi:predicted phage baseplate assembly protein
MRLSEICRDKGRRRALRSETDETGQRRLNGIDYVEISEDQLALTLYFLGKAPEQIGRENIRIEGGRRVRDIRVMEIRLLTEEDPDLDDALQILVDRAGDFSIYTLRLVNADDRGRPGTEPLIGFDPRYAQIEFSFKAHCPSDLDCLPQAECPPPTLPEPEISYLAKDYASFRQLLLDRLALLMPEWTERHLPDIGITLVEILAYVGDHLSYYQDAVATEAYLDTARRRLSVRRHVRLVDYRLHEGCNARTWVTIRTKDNLRLDKAEVAFITGLDASLAPSSRVLTWDALLSIPESDYEVFEPLTEQAQIQLYEAHSSISFSTWEERECCLPRGATSATLLDHWGRSGKSASYQGAEAPAPRERTLKLEVGDVLIFEEVLGPRTGNPADADPTHRHAVRLTQVQPDVDPLNDQPVIAIEWAEADALPFPLCLSTIGEAPGCQYLPDVSVARGNVLLVDHGRTVHDEPWGVPPVKEGDAGCKGEGEPNEPLLRPGRLRPRLERQPVTYRAPFPLPQARAHEQTRLLAGLMETVRTRVRRLADQARRGDLTPQALSAIRAEIATLFGDRALAETNLPRLGQRTRRPVTGEDVANAIERLIAREKGYLARKRRRVEFLQRRSWAGYLLTADETDELRDLFGPVIAGAFNRSNPQLLGPASAALQQDLRAALPEVRVEEGKQRWRPRYDLLASDGEDRAFVVEVESDGSAVLRFGDGELGRALTPGATLSATYRVGNGSAGNVGAETITHLVLRNRTLSGTDVEPRNPLPAQGGVDPEPIAEAKLLAPSLFRTDLQRAITTDDYARLAERHPRVQCAAATFRWTGGWYEVLVAIDPFREEDADKLLLDEIATSLHRYRRIGHDLVVARARSVALDVELSVCVLPHYLSGHVEAALRDRFSTRILPGGERGFFHPDNFSFGDGIYLSRLVAAAQAVPGVESVVVTRLQRQFEAPNGEIESGVLSLGPLEIARLDNDRNAPENGILTLDLRGGR